MFKVFLIFFRIGLTAFGGGSVIIQFLKKEFVETNIISASDFLTAMALSQSTPGPIAGSTATFVGYKLYGLFGVLIANIGITLPSFLIVIIFSKVLKNPNFKSYADKIFTVLKPIITAMVISVVIFLANQIILNGRNITKPQDIYTFINLKAVVISLILIAFSLRKNFSPIALIAIGGILGGIFL